MSARNVRFNLSIPLCLSLIAHGGMVWWVVHEQIENTIAFLLAGQPAPVLETGTSSASPIFDQQAKDDKVFEIDMELGDWNGTGTAIAPSEGEQPLAGRKGGQDQPFLSRDPVGQGRVGDAPTQYTGPTGKGEQSQAAEQLRESVALPSPGEAMAAMQFPLEAPKIIAPTPKPVIGPGNAPPAQPPAGPTVIASTGGQPQQPAQQPADAPRNSADPAPLSDSEIDLFSKNNVVEFRQGKAVPQFGRKAKLTRPRIPLVGAIDAFAMGRRIEVELVLKTDEKGQVISARVARGSGSNEIDNPVRREAYNWSFDPGEPDHPLPREFPIVVAIYD